MKSFSAQYVFTNTGTPLKRGIITTGNDGTILSVEPTGGDLAGRHSIEFFDGIIIPGFVNCHCHLELSHMKGLIPKGRGLENFIAGIRTNRDKAAQDIITAATEADIRMDEEGIVLCADICNTSATFGIKGKSRIMYKNLLEVFGLDPQKAHKRTEEMKAIARDAEDHGLQYWIVPHSAYSLSLPLFKRVKEMGEHNEITSIHFMEAPGEKEFLEKRSGKLMDSYLASGIISTIPETAGSFENVIINEITGSGNLILVHNTFADRETVRAVRKRKNIFFCLCPCSNAYITGYLPPAEMLYKEGCKIVTGTDSLASNNRLSILDEIRALQDNYSSLTMEELIRWATLNGALALNETGTFGSVEPGKKPGLLLLQNIDLINMKILPETTVRRLI